MDLYQKRIERKIKKLLFKSLKKSSINKEILVAVVKERGFHEYDINKVINKLIDKNYILDYDNDLKLNRDELDNRNYFIFDLVSNSLELILYVIGFLVKSLIRLMP